MNNKIFIDEIVYLLQNTPGSRCVGREIGKTVSCEWISVSAGDGYMGIHYAILSPLVYVYSFTL